MYCVYKKGVIQTTIIFRVHPGGFLLARMNKKKFLSLIFKN